MAGLEGVGVHAQAHPIAGAAQGLAGHTHGRFHHFRHAAVEEHGLGTQGRHGSHGVGNPFTGAQHGFLVWLGVFQREGGPEGLAILRQLCSPEGSLRHAALCFGQPDVHVRCEAPHERLCQCRCLCHVEQVGSVRAEERRQRSSHAHRAAAFTCGLARQPAGGVGQGLGFVLEAVADVEGHHGVAVGRDDLRAGTDEVQVCLKHGLGGFGQRQG